MDKLVRRRYKRRTGFKKRRPYIARINRSLYNNDAWITVQVRKPLIILQQTGPTQYEGVTQMRTDLATSASPDWTWLDQPEY